MLTRILPDANTEYVAQQEQEMDQAAALNAQEAEAIGSEAEAIGSENAESYL